jgi:adenosine tuberculosinyltransferase
MTSIEREEFLNLPAQKVAEIVHAMLGPQVCVFPVNGTRRWFMLEHASDVQDDWMQAYLDIAGKKHTEIYARCFEHGLDTVVSPVFGGELLNRGEEYVQRVTADGLSRLATHPDFLSFYKQYQVRVQFYGDYRKQLAGTPFSYLSDQFEHIVRHTEKHHRYRLFYGVYASESTEQVAELTVRHFQKTSQVPTRRDLIELYYGEYIEKANIFIGFEKFNVFDYPLLGWGEESLYFTVAPSLYLTDRQMRNILYDYLFLRPVQDPDYTEMPAEDFEAMRQFYETNRETTFGIGEMRGGIWYPKSGVQE